MIDGTLKNPFFPRKEDGSLVQSNMSETNSSEDNRLFSIIGDEDSSDDEDEFFVDDSSSDDEEDTEPLFIEKENEKYRTSCVEIDYNLFVSKIWPKINCKKEFTCHASLAFVEIISFIKGSFEALQNKNGYLTKEQYKNIGKKRAFTFAAESGRETIYKIFKRYQQVKKWMCTKTRRFHFDKMDLVHHIYKSLCRDPYSGVPLHSVYHDEIQDSTQAELALHFMVCSDANGFFFTGDTCQTIARGVGFRFSDLRTLFYLQKENSKVPAIYTQGEIPSTRTDDSPGEIIQHTVPLQPAVMLSPVEIAVPSVIHLTRNFRSHSGVTNLAASVVELLQEFFPLSFDKDLPKDKGIFQGPLPLLLESNSIQHLEILLKGTDKEEHSIEFGAHQVILVRNKES